MNIPLHEFEQVISSTILDRGLRYFKNGKVGEITELAPGEYEAIVRGTQDYMVSLSLKNNIITWFNCDCPYDRGPVCKHLSAVIFELQKDILQFEEESSGSRKKRTVNGQDYFMEVLHKLDQGELERFVEAWARNDSSFRNRFLATYAHLDTQVLSKDIFKKEIQSVVTLAEGRGGYISWHEMPVLVAGLTPIVDKIEKYFEVNQHGNVFNSSAALLEEMTAAFEFADDSNGDIGYHVNFAMDMLYKLAGTNIPEALQNELFDYGISTFKSGKFKDWDWHLGMLELAVKIVKREREALILLELLDEDFDRYHKERAEVLQLSLILKYRSKAEAASFIEAHMSNPQIRRSEIEKALQNEDFERAIGLARNGIENDEKDYPGLAKEWYNWLLKIAEEQKDVPNIIKYAKYLYLDHFSSSRDYYQLLKDHIAGTAWPEFVNDLVKEIKASNGYGKLYLLQKIFIKEEWWDRLYATISPNPSFGEIERVEEYLAKDYAKELVELYGKICVDQLEQNIGRKHYREVCRYLRRMKKLGGEERVNDLVHVFREEYSRRPALLEELGKI